MIRKCDTIGIHLNKMNLRALPPYLWLRNNIFYCRMEMPKINGKRRFLRFSLNTESYYKAREMIKNIANMDCLFEELEKLYKQLSCRCEFVQSDDSISNTLVPRYIVDENSDKELLKKIYTTFEKCCDIPLDGRIKGASEYIEDLDDLIKLKPDSIQYIEEIRETKKTRENWKKYLSDLYKYKETYQKVKALIPQIQELLYPSYQVPISTQDVGQYTQQTSYIPTSPSNKPPKPLPNIGILISEMVKIKNNCKKESKREIGLLTNMLEEVGISTNDDYSKLYDQDLIKTIGENINRLDVKGNQKCIRKRYLNDLMKYVCARSNHYYTTDFIDLLPRFKKTKKSETNHYLPFEEDELIKMFDPQYDFFKENPDVFWACLIGLYTGSRTRAASTPQFKDIIVVKNKLPCIDINLNHEIKRVKTDITIRQVPLHDDLLELGFLEYVERHKKERKAKDDDFIFPDCQTCTGQWNEHFFDRGFFPFLKELGIKKIFEDEEDKTKKKNKDKNNKKQKKKPQNDYHDFQSFRKTINLALEDAEINETYIQQICGWEGKDVREAHYSLRQLLDIKTKLDKLSYDFLKPAFAEWKKIMATK